MTGPFVDIVDLSGAPAGATGSMVARLPGLLAGHDVRVLPAGVVLAERTPSVRVAVLDAPLLPVPGPPGSRAVLTAEVSGVAGAPVRTAGDARFRLDADPGAEYRVWFTFDEREGGPWRDVTLAVDGEPAVTLRVGAGVRRATEPVVVPIGEVDRRAGTTISIVSRDGDGRPAGITVTGFGVGDGPRSHRPPARIGGRRRAAAASAAVPPGVAECDVIVVPSRMVRRWVAHAWGRDAAVLPTAVPAPGARSDPPGNVILVPGPIRDRRHDASRRQLDLLSVFRTLLERGRCPGWSLVIAGAVAPGSGDAADAVVRMAAATPGARVLLDPRPDELAAAMAGASLVWSVTGTGDDPLAEPAGFEAECPDIAAAMAMGCVPIVVEGNGTDDLVEPGENGLLVPSFALLLAGTEELASDPARLATLREGARRVAIDRSEARTRARAEAIVAAVSGSR